ncbi:MAG: hypothetical protein KDK70_35545, partial [Myxococcales bacterium]|nr:hypothetical protein [Myxococcales bacterium]
MVRRHRGVLVLAIAGAACVADEGREEPTGPSTSGPTLPPTSGADATEDATTAPSTTAGTTDDTSASGVDSSSGGGANFDLGGIPDLEPPACLQCNIELMTTQSNAFHELGGMPLVVSAELDGHTVFGIGEADAGRLAFSGDGNVIYREGTCPLWEWLGATGSQPPRVLCIGADWPCSGLTGGNPPLEINALHDYPGQLDYGGLTLPPAYEGDPVGLRADYDVVAYFAVLDFATGGWSADPGDAATLEAFVRAQGGGLYLISEYWGGGMQQPQLDSLNALAQPWSIEYEQRALVEQAGDDAGAVRGVVVALGRQPGGHRDGRAVLGVVDDAHQPRRPLVGDEGAIH